MSNSGSGDLSPTITSPSISTLAPLSSGNQQQSSTILHRRTPSQPNMSTSLSGSYGSLNSQFPPLPTSTLQQNSSSRQTINTIKSQQLNMAQQILQHHQQQLQQQQQQQLYNSSPIITSSSPFTPISSSSSTSIQTSSNNNNTTSSANNNTPPARKKYKPLQRYNSYDNDQTVCYGWLVILLTMIFFMVTTYCLVISKFLPDTGNRILDFIKYDWYYCLLVPVIIPVTIITVYLNWLSLKFFRHN